MLLFISTERRSSAQRQTFQYISCYCLSVEVVSATEDLRKFQYISCYCLSRPLMTSNVPLATFQYISCYCLSFFPPCHKIFIKISIHLMLLFIKAKKWFTDLNTHFNTSHVTVYPVSYHDSIVLV